MVDLKILRKDNVVNSKKSEISCAIRVRYYPVEITYLVVIGNYYELRGFTSRKGGC